MRGDAIEPGAMFSYISAAERVPQDHPLRAVRTMVDVVLCELSPHFQKLYSHTGRPSIPQGLGGGPGQSRERESRRGGVAMARVTSAAHPPDVHDPRPEHPRLGVNVGDRESAGNDVPGARQR